MAPNVGNCDVDSIVHKSSSVKGKEPLPGQLEYGEIAVNYAAAGPFLSVKASDGSIRRIGSSSVSGALVFAGTIDATRQAAPASPKPGTSYVNLGSGTPDPSWALTTGTTLTRGEMLLWNGSRWELVGASLGSGGGVNAITAQPPLSISGTTSAPDIDIATATQGVRGVLRIATLAEARAATPGLAVDPDVLDQLFDDLKRILAGGLTYKGVVSPISPPPATVLGDLWVISRDGVFDASWGAPVAGTIATAGEMVIYDGIQWDIVGVGSAPTADYVRRGVVRFASLAEIQAGTAFVAVDPAMLDQAVMTAGTF